MSDQDDCHGRDSGDGQASTVGPATDGPAGLSSADAVGNVDGALVRPMDGRNWQI